MFCRSKITKLYAQKQEMRRKKYDRRKVFPYFSLLLHVNHSIKHTQVKLHISSSYVKVCLCILPLLPIVTACHDNATNDGPDKAPVRRTVLIYMAAQNSLHKNAQSDSAEIMNGRQYIADNDRLLMFVDDERAPRLYRVTRRCKEPVLLKRWNKDICSTDPEQLREVLSMVRHDYEAKEYGLVMWSHATGWVPSTNSNYNVYNVCSAKRPSAFGIDDGPGVINDHGAQMDIDDMAQAMQQAGWHSKYILFDACLMQNVEVAYALRQVTDYVVASPMSIPSAGAYYTHQLQNGLFANDPGTIARTYYEDVSNPQMANTMFAGMGIAISCVRTDLLQPLADALKTVLARYDAHNWQSYNWPDMTGVLPYQAYSAIYGYRPHNYDAQQALQRILPKEDFQTIQPLLAKAVVCHYATNRIYVGPGYNTFQSMPRDASNYCCMSMFVPQQVYEANASSCSCGNLNTAFGQTAWYKACGMSNLGW